MLKSTVSVLLLSLSLVAQESTRAENLDGKPRLYVDPSPFGGLAGADPQNAEVMKTFGKSCPEVVVTNRPERAKYRVTFERESRKEIIRKHDKLVVFNKDGDMVYSTSTRSLGDAVRGFCKTLR